MLKLAELLCLRGLAVTFLATDHNHRRLLRSATDIESLLWKRYAGRFRFEVIPDGLPGDHPRSAEHLGEVVGSLEAEAEAVVRGMMGRSEVTCAIAEGMFGYVFETGREFGVPVYAFETISPCCLYVYLSIPKLFQAGQLPIRGEDLDRVIAGVPGMECLLRARDLPHFFRAQDPWAEKNIELVKAEMHYVPKAHGLILNTFEDLDGPILSNIRTHCPKMYTIGPVQQHLKTRLAGSESPISHSFWEEDKTCMQWLDRQPDKSVIYVSFGSLATLTAAQISEFRHGLAASGVSFLWVVRPNIVQGLDDDNNNNYPTKLVQTPTAGCVVRWAPQEEVLHHPAIGGFLTHSGWNSMLESIIAGKPMICWALGVDQMVTSRLVSEVWKVGLDIKDKCDRVTVENAVRELMTMGKRREELEKSMEKLSWLARESVNGGGSSHASLDQLVDDISRLR
ncbi:unnamed protein product [Cuscuta campestris]|uniref:Glycosyltransferase n=1 Tax=Cuscuta campestris TaxID=132261 RepID=A0A484L979_9ASTE|nr:unnamed protein product [Cuscuta campestris]